LFQFPAEPANLKLMKVKAPGELRRHSYRVAAQVCAGDAAYLIRSEESLMLGSPLKYPAFLNANTRLPQMHQVRRSILEKLRRRIEEESSSPEPDPHLRSWRP
jgi:hypothetical protein